MPRVPTEQPVFIPRVVPKADEGATISRGIAELGSQAQKELSSFHIERQDARRKHQLSQELSGFSVELTDKRTELRTSDDIPAMRSSFERFAEERAKGRLDGIRDDVVRRAFETRAVQISSSMALDVGDDEFARERDISRVEIKKSMEEYASQVSATDNDVLRGRLRQSAMEAATLSDSFAPEEKVVMVEEFERAVDLADAERMLREDPEQLLLLPRDSEMLDRLTPVERQRLVSAAEAEIDRQIRAKDADAARVLSEQSDAAVTRLNEFAIENPGDSETLRTMVLEELVNLEASQQNVFRNVLSAMASSGAKRDINPNVPLALTRAWAVSDFNSMQRQLGDPEVVQEFADSGRMESYFTWQSRVGKFEPLRQGGLAQIGELLESDPFGGQVNRDIRQMNNDSANREFVELTTGKQFDRAGITEIAAQIGFKWLQMTMQGRTEGDREAGTALPPPYQFQGNPSRLFSDKDFLRSVIETQRGLLQADMRSGKIDPPSADVELEQLREWEKLLRAMEDIR